MSGLIPSIGTSGVFVLASPYESQLVPNAKYTCKGVRALGELTAGGIDPYTTYYSPNNIDRAQYETDLNNGVCIVSLSSDLGTWLYVPSSYIVSFPNANGHSYTSIGVVLDLGPVPDELDLTYLKSRLINVCLDVLGITSTATTVALSRSIVLSTTEHNGITAVREAAKSNSGTEYARLVTLTQQNTELRDQNAALMLYIRDHVTP